MKIPYKYLIIILLTILLILFFVSLVVGRFSVSISDIFGILGYRFFSRIIPINQTWEPISQNVILHLRLPRIFAAILIGAALSTAGATYQGLFRNPMVSPDFLGVSSGAAIGASIAFVLNLSFQMVQILAFFGGIIAVLLTTAIPKILRNDSIAVLVLSGIVVSGLFGSIMSIIRYIANPVTALPQIIFWQMGSLATVTMQEVFAIFIPILISLFVLTKISWWLNIISLGEGQSVILGLNYKFYRFIGIIFSTILAILSVSVAGQVGWIGLAIPHFARLLVGVDNKKIMPICILTGAIFMLLVDTLARTITAGEIPLSVLTGFLGAPFFLFLIYKQRKKI